VSGTGRYLFAVARGLPDDALIACGGIHGQELRSLEVAGLQAIVCAVELDEFGEEALHRNLEDLRWVEQVARTHDEVVRAVAAAAAVAPMRLVTIYEDDENVRRQVERLRDQLESALDRVAGSAEWSVKVYSRDAATPSAPPTRETSGAAYLKRKREDAAARRSIEDRADRVAGELHDALTARSHASRLLAPQDPRLSGRAERMIHNGAYLVAYAQEQDFRTTVEALSEWYPDLAIELQGPWPPYSFAVLETS
jgi:hypothetical protein